MVLAAGAGSRFAPGPDAAHKLLAPLDGRTVVWWAVSDAARAGIGPVWVVTGAADLSRELPEDAVVLANPRWAEGQATSLAVAVAAAAAEGLEAVVVGLGDQPFVGPASWAAVAAGTGGIAVATYDGRRRHPVRLSSDVWDLLPASGDEGARPLMKARPDLVVEIPCQGEPADIDTREDLRRWS